MDKKILMVLMLGIFMISLISAFDFDNVKYYDDETKTAKVKDCSLWIGTCFIDGEEIADVTLDTPHENFVPMGEDVLFAEITLDNKKTEYLNVLTDMMLVDLKNNNETIEREIKYKYLTTREIPYIIKERVYDKDNITFIEEDVIKYYTEEYWEDFDFKKVNKGVYKIGLFADIYYGDHFDWKPTLYGVEIPEWAVVIQSSGTETTDGDYTVHTFTSNGYFNISAELNASVLIVGGGAGGGSNAGNGNAGGGGSGAMFLDYDVLVSAGDYVVTVGIGGDAGTTTWGFNGTSSSFNSVTRLGGGGGGHYNGFDGLAGGSGGGGSQNEQGGAGNTGGNAGGDGHPTSAGGGGGGSGATGETAPNANEGGDGGAGLSSTIYNGTTLWYAGGGGGGATTRGEGGIGGGDFGTGGGCGSEVQGSGALDGTGGGGGAGHCLVAGSDGGDGIVIIRYLTADTIPVPSLVLDNPINYTNQTTNDVNFSCTPTLYYTGTVKNNTLILDGVRNETDARGLNNTISYFDKTLSEGWHTWSCEVFDDGDNANLTASWVVNVSFDPPHVALSLPVNNSNQTSSSIHFNATVWDDIGITNVSLILDGVVNETNSTDANNSVYGFDKIMADGSSEWTIRSVDNYGNITTAGIYFLNIDTVYPVVSASNLTDIVTTSLPTNSTWGFNASDTNIDLCYYNSTASAVYNITTCNSSITDLAWATGGNKTIQFCANDTFGLETCNTEYIWVYSITETQADTPDPIGEGATATFNFTINLTDIATTTATLMMNGSIFSPTSTTAGSDGYYFVYNLVIPDGWGNTTGNEINWSWNYTITGISTNASTTMTNITVYEMAVDDCTTYEQVILNLSLRDEEGNSVIDGLVDNTTIEVEINLTSTIDQSIQIEYSATFSNETNPQLCVPLNLINTTNYTTDITIGFDSTNRVWEFWHLDNGTVDLAGNFNSYTTRNVNLMDLLTADSTSFLFNYFDVDGQAVDGSIAHVYRKFIGEGLFREVERSKADQNGDTIVHLVEEDVIYYFMITLEGAILYTSSTYTALCQEVPCTINIEEGGESAEFDTDYDLVDGGGYSINSSRSTRHVSLVYDLNTSATMNFTLYKYESDGSFGEINSSQQTGLSGVINLNVPQSAGNVSFFASVVKDDVFVNSEWVDFEGQAVDYFGSILSIFFGALLILTLGLMAVSTGAGVLVWVMVGLFIAGAFGLFATTLSTGVSIVIYLIIAGALLLWKITGGRK